MNYQLSVRLSKSIVSACVALFCIIVGLNNIVDFGTNFNFVQHVLSMDAMEEWFKGDGLRSRAIVSNTFHILSYWLIIICQIIAGAICLYAAIKMLKNINSEKYNQSKAIYLLGATLAILIWYLGFGVIGSEWFVMWASKWNGQHVLVNSNRTLYFENSQS